MLVTESGITNDVKPVPRNASKPILVTELGIVTDVKPDIPLKNPSAIVVVPAWIIAAVCVAETL